ncbi:hypothetical protein [Pedobacter faecalis]|uniref:hypothetical protein n=1 Tax=Pedobacter faecalis TaxID=3041495 RepID=UPI002551AEAB|nr:hypothetical protein [Pedobacter sp. ELA7]
MKKLFLTAAIAFSGVFAMAQSNGATVTKVETRTVSGAELKRMIGNVKITDPKVYDREGNVVDSAEVVRRLATYEYQKGWTQVNGEYRHLITKIDTVRQAAVDRNTKLMLKPASAKLQEGVTLDLRPFKSHVDVKALQGKAIVLVFWCDGCYGGSQADAYKPVNEVLSRFYNPDKLAIITVTHHAIEHSFAALKKNPIINTQHIVAAPQLAREFETNGRPVLVLADTNHKILYAVKDNAMMTPRILYFALKDL